MFVQPRLSFHIVYIPHHRLSRHSDNKRPYADVPKHKSNQHQIPPTLIQRWSNTTECQYQFPL